MSCTRVIDFWHEGKNLQWYSMTKIRPSAFGRWPYFWASLRGSRDPALLDGVQEVLPGVVHGVTHVLHGAAHAGLHGPLPG